MQMKLYRARLHTEKTDEQIRAMFSDHSGEVTEKVIEATKKYYALANELECVVSQSGYMKGRYILCDVVNESDADKLKELFWLTEQDEFCGTYTDNRDGFERIWAADEYCPDCTLYFDEADVEILEELAANVGTEDGHEH